MRKRLEEHIILLCLLYVIAVRNKPMAGFTPIIIEVIISYICFKWTIFLLQIRDLSTGEKMILYVTNSSRIMLPRALKTGEKEVWSFKNIEPNNPPHLNHWNETSFLVK